MFDLGFEHMTRMVCNNRQEIPWHEGPSVSTLEQNSLFLEDHGTWYVLISEARTLYLTRIFHVEY